MKEYKWFKLIDKPSKSKTLNARIILRNKTILIYPNFYTHKKVKQKAILEHEVAHYVYSKLPILYKIVWKLIDNWKLIKLSKYKKNAFVSEYAKKNNIESFCECIKMDYLFQNIRRIEFEDYADFKISIAVNLYNNI